MEHDDLTERLRALGREPVPAPTRDDHLRRMAATPAAPSRRGFGRLAVAGAAVVGFLAGSTGLAVAGALPDPAQDVAHDVLSVVQVDVPEGTRGACVSAAARNKELTPEEKQTAKDACPEGGPPPWAGQGGDGEGPGRSGEAPGRSGEAPGKAGVDADPCRGKPPWAGPGISEEERARLKAEVAAACPERGADEDAEDEAAEDDAPG